MDRRDPFGIRDKEKGGVWIPERESTRCCPPTGMLWSPYGLKKKMGNLRIFEFGNFHENDKSNFEKVSKAVFESFFIKLSREKIENYLTGVLWLLCQNIEIL